MVVGWIIGSTLTHHRVTHARSPHRLVQPTNARTSEVPPASTRRFVWMPGDLTCSASFLYLHAIEIARTVIHPFIR